MRLKAIIPLPAITRTGWHHNGRTRHERGYGAAWDKLRRFILARDKHQCQACLVKHRYTPATEVDHITPKAKGGTDDAENLQALCRSCHQDKTVRDAGHRPRQAIGADGWPLP